MKVKVHSDKHGTRREDTVWYTDYIGETFEVDETPLYTDEMLMYRVIGGKYNGYGIYVVDTKPNLHDKFLNMPSELFEI